MTRIALTVLAGAYLVLYLALGAAMVAFSGCGGNAAQVAISGQASVIVSTRPARFDGYAAEHDRCLAASGDVEGYRVCMSPARRVAQAVDAYRELLFAAQAAVDAGNGGPAIGCAIEGARRVLRAMDAADLPIPPEVQQIASFLPEVPCGSR